MMVALPPSPRDFALFAARMDAFCFTRNGTCRTIEMLARRIGQRRDATRAPTQVRNGWRLRGRLHNQPAVPSKDCRFFVQTMGSTSEIHTGLWCTSAPVPARQQNEPFGKSGGFQNGKTSPYRHIPDMHIRNETLAGNTEPHLSFTTSVHPMQIIALILGWCLYAG
jgi:hypothetical protein